ncbi:MAG: chorismate mutase [Nitrospinota bacterium]|jgi:chorismate mutase|nr:chorismate mutase [Nitrospinota bacterium]
MEKTGIRPQIDELDEQIVRLLNRRATLGLRAGEAKRVRGEPIHDSDREAEVLKRVSSKATGPLPPDALVRIYSRIIEETRSLEELESG